MSRFSHELSCATGAFCEAYDELKSDAARQLGSLFDPADYPANLRSLFEVTWDFPNLGTPPQNLALCSSVLHATEESRIAWQFETAIRLAEQGFVKEFTSLVGHVSERTAAALESGQTRVIRKSALTKVVDFIGRYRMFELRTNARLDELINLVERTLQGVTSGRLRGDHTLRRTVAAQLSWVKTSLGGDARELCLLEHIRQRTAPRMHSELNVQVNFCSLRNTIKMTTRARSSI